MKADIFGYRDGASLRALIAATVLLSGLQFAQAHEIPSSSFERSLSRGQNESSQPPAQANQTATDSRLHPDRSTERLSESHESQRASSSSTATDEKHEATIEWWLMAWTAGLFVATAALAIFALAQVFLFAWQLRIIRSSVDDAKQAADAAKAQVKLAREEFIASHRPLISIRWVRLTSGDPTPKLALVL